MKDGNPKAKSGVRGKKLEKWESVPKKPWQHLIEREKEVKK
jgi:hypothetical protein